MDEIINMLTKAIRIADRDFEKIGGSTRHYVRDALLPVMEELGIEVAIKLKPIASPIYFNSISNATNALCKKKNKRLSYFIVTVDLDTDMKELLNLYNYRKNGNEYIQLNNNLNTIIRVIQK